jgi:hypothetical protein
MLLVLLLRLKRSMKDQRSKYYAEALMAATQCLMLISQKTLSWKVTVIKRLKNSSRLLKMMFLKTGTHLALKGVVGLPSQMIS